MGSIIINNPLHHFGKSIKNLKTFISGFCKKKKIGPGALIN